MTERLPKLLCALLACCTIASAQSERGSIRGTVQDPSGSPITGVNVVAISAGTGVQTATVTTGAGNYNIPQLPPGDYQVRAQHPGFRTLLRENVTVEVGGVVALDLKLEIGNVNESVTISAAAPILQGETSEISTTVSPKAYNDLPLSSAGGGRAPQNFMFLSPGVTPGGTGSTTNTFDAHVNGSQTLSTELQVDGVSSQTAEVGGDPRNLTFPPDAIQEMSVTTSTYSAEFGNTGGGVEQFVVKSGTNGLHGTLYEFLRNDVFDARGFYNAKRSAHRENEYGFSVGGPVVIPKVYDGRSKTFFFTNLNYYKLRQGAQNQLGSVPNQAFRSGDLSGLVNSKGQQVVIYDPATTVPDGQGGFTRTPFPNNIIPANRISNASKNILSYVPNPTLPGVYSNYASSSSGSIQDYKDWITKIDHYFTSERHLSGTLIRGWRPDNGPYSILPHPVENTRDGIFPTWLARLNYDWILSPTLLNTIRIGYNRQHQLLASVETTTNYGALVGIAGINNGFPGVNWGAFTPLAQNQDRIEPVSNTFIYADTLAWTKGRNNFKFGGEYRRLQHNGRYPNRGANFNFSTVQTAFPSGDLHSTTGNEFASFLLGNVNGASEYINNVVAGERLNYLGLYAIDDWKITPKLTLNLGIRWDLFTNFTEVANRYSVMDPRAPNPAAGGLPGAYVFAGGNGAPYTGTSQLTTNSTTDFLNFAPRLGFAWRPINLLVVRGGYGISYYPTGGQGGGNVTSVNDGYSTNANFVSDGINPSFQWDNGFPQNYPRPPSIDAGLNVGHGANMWWDNAYKPTYKQDFNFTIQKQLAPNLALDVAYVGSKSTRLATGAVNPNQLDPRYLSLGNLLTNDINSSAVVASGFKPPYAGFTGTLAQSFRPFPQYTNVGTLSSANIGNATYNSLQAKLEKRFSGDFGSWPPTHGQKPSRMQTPR